MSYYNYGRIDADLPVQKLRDLYQNVQAAKDLILEKSKRPLLSRAETSNVYYVLLRIRKAEKELREAIIKKPLDAFPFAEKKEGGSRATA